MVYVIILFTDPTDSSTEPNNLEKKLKRIHTVRFRTRLLLLRLRRS